MDIGGCRSRRLGRWISVDVGAEGLEDAYRWM